MVVVFILSCGNMKVVISEEQYNRYLARRVDCMRDYIGKLKRGEVELPIPIYDSDWVSYNFIFSAILRLNCGDVGGANFNKEIHEEIMKLFKDELLDIFIQNKNPRS